MPGSAIHFLRNGSGAPATLPFPNRSSPPKDDLGNALGQESNIPLKKFKPLKSRAFSRAKPMCGKMAANAGIGTAV
jgi:hypothetical protein